MASRPPFEQARAKVCRAHTHIAELAGKVRAFLDRKPYRLVVEPHGDPGRVVLRYRVREAPPAELPLIVGDIVHNLRTALDLAACEAVRLNDYSDADVAFPFGSDAKGLENAIKSCRINRAVPGIEDLIRALKPYTGGNDKLRALHDLDIRDKHRTNLVLANFGALPAGLPEGLGITVGQNVHFGPVDDGFTPFIGNHPAGVNIGDEIPATFTLTLEPLGWFGGELIASMNTLADLVHGILDQFVAVVVSHPSPNP